MVHSSQRKYDSANHVQPTHAWCDRTCCSEVAVKCDCAALLIVPGCKHSAVSFSYASVHSYSTLSPLHGRLSIWAKAACAGPLDAIVICCQRFSASQIALQYERDIFPLKPHPIIYRHVLTSRLDGRTSGWNANRNCSVDGQSRCGYNSARNHANRSPDPELPQARVSSICQSSFTTLNSKPSSAKLPWQDLSSQ